MQDLVGPVPLLVRNCTISGTKYHDLDGDGATPPDGEPTLAGWKLYLDLDNDNVLDANEPTTLTDANGDYTFEDPLRRRRTRCGRLRTRRRRRA